MDKPVDILSPEHAAYILAEDEHDYHYMRDLLTNPAEHKHITATHPNNTGYTWDEVDKLVEYFDKFCTCPECDPAT